MSEQRPLRRPRYVAAALAIGVCSGVAFGLPIAAGDIRPTIVGLGLLAVVALLARRMLPEGDRLGLGVVIVLALAVRFATAVVLRETSLGLGRSGWITGDDQSYEILSWAFAQWLRGQPEPPYVPPTWNTEVYLFGTYVYLESFMFLLFGRQVLVMQFVNGAAMVIGGLLMFDIARRAFGARAGNWTLVLVLFHPSIAVWSALNLKDSISLMLIAATFWVVQRIQSGMRWPLFAVLAVILFPIQSLRRYVFLLLLIAAPIGIALAPIRGRSADVTKAVVAAVFALTLYLDFSGSSYSGGAYTNLFEQVRQAMGTGARTGYQERLPVSVREGDVFVITTPQPTAISAPAPTPTPCPTHAPVTVVVPHQVDLVLVSACLLATPPPSGFRYYVRPGDFVIVVSMGTTSVPAGGTRPLSPGALPTPTPTPTPTSIPQPLVMNTTAPLPSEFISRENTHDAELQPAVRLSDEDAATRTVKYLPKGVFYALFAPFPWALGRTIDLLTVPEMLAWYALLPIAIVSGWRLRARWRSLAPIWLFCVGLLSIFALTEGNYGTLYRHRAMLIPFVILIAVPLLIEIADRGRAYRRRSLT